MKRLLFIAHRVPYPPDKGDRVRAFHEIKALAEEFRVTLATLAHGRQDREAARELRNWCEEVIVCPAGGKLGLLRGGLSLLAGGSVTGGYFHSRRLHRRLGDEAAREPFDLAFAYCTSVLPYALSIPAVAHVVDLVDVDSAKWFSYAGTVHWPKRWLYRREARGVARLERLAVEGCSAVVAVSEAELAALGVARGNLVPVANGVDSEFFAPGAVAPADLGRSSLVFTGQMDYWPNVQAVCGFAEEVWPDLRKAAPDLTFWVVGRNPTPVVRALARVPGITVTGSVPDVRPYLAAATVAVVPLRIGRGIQNKVLEAMAMGKPVVASGAALEGLDVVVGGDVIQADTLGQWRGRLSELLGDEGKCMWLGRSARQRVVCEYVWPEQMSRLVALCRRLVQKPAAESADISGVSCPDSVARRAGLA